MQYCPAHAFQFSMSNHRHKEPISEPHWRLIPWSDICHMHPDTHSHLLHLISQPFPYKYPMHSSMEMNLKLQSDECSLHDEDES